MKSNAWKLNLDKFRIEIICNLLVRVKKYCTNLPRKIQDFTASKVCYPKDSLSKRYAAD